MIVVNFYGPPGTGKSTSAAYCFSHLKNRGCNVELNTEFAKQMVYSRRGKELGNQLYVTAKQYKKVHDIETYEKVPIVITDCPLLLGLIYSEGVFYQEQLKALIWKIFNNYENINVLLRRTKPYNPSGRLQSEEESDALIPKLEALGIKWDYIINGDEYDQKKFAEHLYEKYKERIKL